MLGRLIACADAEPYDARKRQFKKLQGRVRLALEAAMYIVLRDEDTIAAPDEAADAARTDARRRDLALKRARKVFNSIRREGFEETALRDPMMVEGFREGAQALNAIDGRITTFLERLSRIDRSGRDLTQRFAADRGIFRAQFLRLYGGIEELNSSPTEERAAPTPIAPDAASTFDAARRQMVKPPFGKFGVTAIAAALAIAITGGIVSILSASNIGEHSTPAVNTQARVPTLPAKRLAMIEPVRADQPETESPWPEPLSVKVRSGAEHKKSVRTEEKTAIAETDFIARIMTPANKPETPSAWPDADLDPVAVSVPKAVAAMTPDAEIPQYQMAGKQIAAALMPSPHPVRKPRHPARTITPTPVKLVFAPPPRRKPKPPDFLAVKATQTADVTFMRLVERRTGTKTTEEFMASRHKPQKPSAIPIALWNAGAKRQIATAATGRYMDTAAIRKLLLGVSTYGPELMVRTGEFRWTWYEPDGTFYAERDYEIEAATGVWWTRDPDILCWRITQKNSMAGFPSENDASEFGTPETVISVTG